MYGPRRLTGLLLVVAFAACDLPAGPRAESRPEAEAAPLIRAEADGIPDRYIVVFEPETGAPAALGGALVSLYGGAVHYSYEAALSGFAATLSPGALEAVRRHPRVAYVAQDAMVRPMETQDDAIWGLDRISQRDLPLDGTYGYTRTGAGVTVYVVDTGIHYTHAEFGGRARLGYDFVEESDPGNAGEGGGTDCNGHGTHVAGTIAGETYGVAKEAEVVSVRVFGCFGGAAFSVIIAAVDWITANAEPPAVTNMSLGGGFFPPINEAVARSVEAGIVNVAAAGNENADACLVSPASVPEALTVGATTAADRRASFSNWGPCVDLFAPGHEILSAWWESDDAAESLQGTSMAAPHVAGVAALYLEAEPEATPAEVGDAILGAATANRLTGLGPSPNLLLFNHFEPEPAASLILLDPTYVLVNFVRYDGWDPMVAGLAPSAGPRPTFVARGDGPPLDAERLGARLGRSAGSADTVVLATAGEVVTAAVRVVAGGTVPLEWSATVADEWLSVSPGDGMLNPGFSRSVAITADVSDHLLGRDVGVISFLSDGAANSPRHLGVFLEVAEADVLEPGVPIDDVAGEQGSLRFFVVRVPPGAFDLVIRTSGGTGQIGLYTRRGQVPTYDDWDCRSFFHGNNQSCVSANPGPGVFYIMLFAPEEYDGVSVMASYTVMAPSAPSELRGSAVSATRIDLEWEPADGAAEYRLQRRVDGSWEDAGAVEGDETGFSDTGLRPSTEYRHRVRACNDAGCSAWTEGEPVTTPDD